MCFIRDFKRRPNVIELLHTDFVGIVKMSIYKDVKLDLNVSGKRFSKSNYLRHHEQEENEENGLMIKPPSINNTIVLE